MSLQTQLSNFQFTLALHSFEVGNFHLSQVFKIFILCVCGSENANPNSEWYYTEWIKRMNTYSVIYSLLCSVHKNNNQKDGTTGTTAERLTIGKEKIHSRFFHFVCVWINARKSDRVSKTVWPFLRFVCALAHACNKFNIQSKNKHEIHYH